MKFLKIAEGIYDIDVVGFIRKLRKPIKTTMNNGHQLIAEYVVHLKTGYYLDAKKKSNSIFIGRRDAEGIAKATGIRLEDLDDLAGTPEDPAQQPDVGED